MILNFGSRWQNSCPGCNIRFRRVSIFHSNMWQTIRSALHDLLVVPNISLFLISFVCLKAEKKKAPGHHLCSISGPHAPGRWRPGVRPLAVWPLIQSHLAWVSSIQRCRRGQRPGSHENKMGKELRASVEKIVDTAEKARASGSEGVAKSDHGAIPASALRALKFAKCVRVALNPPSLLPPPTDYFCRGVLLSRRLGNLLDLWTVRNNTYYNVGSFGILGLKHCVLGAQPLMPHHFVL
ncbi:hypothetical protein FB451DRAFT_1378142 [Mycena latifolia]|nr:hypothetical protein FB451DRAFT_1378142 [Mycena latifolia]